MKVHLYNWINHKAILFQEKNSSCNQIFGCKNQKYYLLLIDKKLSNFRKTNTCEISVINI